MYREIVRLPKVQTNDRSATWILLLGGGARRPGWEVLMQASTHNDESVLIAPERLISATRSEFRNTALAHLDQLSADAGALVIDLRHTTELDASGLGMLVLIQKRAKERGLSTRLRQTPERVRNLLKLTLLDFLFELTD